MYLAESININPAHADSYSNRGIIYAQSGSFELAISDFNKAIALKPEFAAAYLNRAMCFMSMKMKTEACNDFFISSQKGNDVANQYLENYCSK
jgi:lipoprotein NlpI